MIPINYKSPIKIIFISFIATVLLGTGLYKLYNLVSSKELTKAVVNNDTNTFDKSNDILENSIITGSDIINIYDEVKDKSFSILVATKEFLLTDKSDLINSNEYPYIRYILSKNDERIVESIKINNDYAPLAFINYNTVLTDTCLYQETESIYKLVYGFNDYSYNEDLDMTNQLPLKATESCEIYKINEDAVFKTKLIRNEEGLLIGYAFLEQ